MIILVGKSASGKTELCKTLTSFYGYKKFVTSTTRAPRVGEINGIDYNFLTLDTFLKMKENNEFIETTFYNGNYYGTEKKLIDDKTVLIVESNGLISFKKLNIKNIVSYLLELDEPSRIKRMIERGDSQNTIDSRIKHDRFKFLSSIDEYVDVYIDEKDKTVEEIAEFVNKDYLARIKK